MQIKHYQRRGIWGGTYLKHTYIICVSHYTTFGPVNC